MEALTKIVAELVVIHCKKKELQAQTKQQTEVWKTLSVSLVPHAAGMGDKDNPRAFLEVLQVTAAEEWALWVLLLLSGEALPRHEESHTGPARALP